MTDIALPTYRADILAIDDTPENLQLLSQMLTQRQYKVRSVTKGSTALRAAQAAPPDLILLDINMPEMNGYEVCERLKADDMTRHIPVIFISALGETLDKVRAFDVGGVDYVTKPFQVEEVIARIETHVQLRRLQQQMQAQNVRLQQEIRDRKQAQETVGKAFRSSPSPIAITTLEGGQFIEVNPSFLKLSGYTRPEVIGFRLDELDLGLDMDAYRRGRTRLEQEGALYNWEFDLRGRHPHAASLGRKHSAAGTSMCIGDRQRHHRTQTLGKRVHFPRESRAQNPDEFHDWGTRFARHWTTWHLDRERSKNDRHGHQQCRTVSAAGQRHS